MSGALATGTSHVIGRLDPRPAMIGSEPRYDFAGSSCVQRRCLPPSTISKAMNNNNNNNDCSAAGEKDGCTALSLSRAAEDGGGDGAGGETGDSPPADGAVVESATPPCIRWATGLRSLLDDKDGVEHFQTFLNEERCSDMLKFWFACQGLKHQPSLADPGSDVTDDVTVRPVDQQTRRLIVAMYRRFIRRPQQQQTAAELPVSESVRRRLGELVAAGSVHARMFDAAQREIEQVMECTLYPNFLQSDYYISLVQRLAGQPGPAAEAASSGCTSCDGSWSECQPTAAAAAAEHEQPPDPPVRPPPAVLTRDALLRTQQCRSRVPVHSPRPPQTGGQKDGVVNPYHTLYSSYNPVSRQDSELQSMSSEATTLTDDTSLDGCRGPRGSSSGATGSSKLSYRRQHRRQQRLIKESARANLEPPQHRGLLIPRTQHSGGKLGVNPSVDFQGFARLLSSRLEQAIIDRQMSDSRHVLQDTIGKLSSRFSEQNDQEILDAHISKVFESSQQTPQQQLSGTHSPSCPQRAVLHHHRHLHVHQPAVSTFSSDSGCVMPRPSSARPLSALPPDSRRLPPSDARRLPPCSLEGGSGHGRRLAGVSAARRAPDVDSGVSLVSLEMSGDSNVGGGRSGDPGMHHHYPLQQAKPVDKVLSWMQSSDSSAASRADSGLDQLSGRSVTSASLHTSHHHRQYPPVAGGGETEVHRSLRVNDGYEGGVMIGGSLKRHPKQQRSSSTYRYSVDVGSVDSLCVAYTFCGDPVPYRTRVSGSVITLRQFKQLLPRKGHYRYFFKTACSDFEPGVIQEEITDDSTLLPLWEGKVQGQVMSRD